MGRCLKSGHATADINIKQQHRQPLSFIYIYNDKTKQDKCLEKILVTPPTYLIFYLKKINEVNPEKKRSTIVMGDWFLINQSCKHVLLDGNVSGSC